MARTDQVEGLVGSFPVVVRVHSGAPKLPDSNPALEWTRLCGHLRALVAWTRKDVFHATNESALSTGVSPRSRAVGLGRPERQGCSRQPGLQREELRELRKRVKRVEQERDILKRAAVLFAAETETR
jgi:hypothetical protein